MKLSKLKGNPSNPRIIKDDKFKKLVKSINDFPKMMALRPIVVDENFIVQGGNMRLKALQEIGFKDIPDEWVKQVKDLSEDEKKQFIIKDNVGFGDWDWDDLANNWDAMQLTEWGLDIPNFEAEVLEAEEDNYSIPDKIKTDIVLGDLFEIGEHRLLCGDSTDSDAVAKLMDGQKADMVFTDPPYGLKVVKNNQIGGGGKLGFVGATGAAKARKYRNVINDETTDTAQKVYLLCEDLGFKNQIIWGGQYFTEFLPTKGCWIVWDKKERDFDNTFSDCELAWTSFEGRTYLYRHLWAGLLRKGNRDIELKERVHPTQKPVGLLGQILNDFTKRNDIVLDLFGGSGSTLIACEQLNRKCYMCEIDNKYIQVIINRWEKLTNKKATKL